MRFILRIFLNAEQINQVRVDSTQKKKEEKVASFLYVEIGRSSLSLLNYHSVYIMPQFVLDRSFFKSTRNFFHPTSFEITKYNTITACAQTLALCPSMWDEVERTFLTNRTKFSTKNLNYPSLYPETSRMV